jgi:hypothetical protein
MKDLIKKIEWFFVELLKVFSDEKSYFSLKRIERGILFSVAVFIICDYVSKNISNITPEGILIITSPLFVYAGFSMVKTEKVRKDEEDKNEI